MLKEYIQLMILDYLSITPYIKKMTFIGGTNLRLVKGIDRFSEDLDFDCKQLSEQDFTEMAEGVLFFLQRSGLRAETREKESKKLKAFRKNIYFPELLFELGLSGYKEERFLIKIESQDQGVDYLPVMVNIKGCGFFFPFPVPSDDILCAMKISALLSRQKGRDFYDAMFLLSLANPNYAYLTQKCDIHNWIELKEALITSLEKVDLKRKSQDFEHLLFQKTGNKILLFRDFIDEYSQ
ncbi:MAG: nucleotidyl transferase AbiEii/AbiGii toxin family protein [Spirochaetia bacterium]|jgi:predicted nucleotidyltransferase component of viral defense system|nr:nucleotidyl transferase AbiEii/AbiGii toxin family protein [Spirochaetia bacterium]